MLSSGRDHGRALKPAARPRIHIVIATSDLHMEHKLRMSVDQVGEAVVLPPERHRGYALQWGLIALAVIGVALAASARRLPATPGEIAHEQS